MARQFHLGSQPERLSINSGDMRDRQRCGTCRVEGGVVVQASRGLLNWGLSVAGSPRYGVREDASMGGTIGRHNVRPLNSEAILVSKHSHMKLPCLRYVWSS